MEWTRKEPQTSQNQADFYFQADNCGAKGFATRPPNLEVAHSLQTDGIEGRCERREIVRNKRYFDRHAGSQDQHSQNQEADAAIVKDAAHHDERRQQDQSGIELKASEDRDEGLRQKPECFVDEVEFG